MPPLVFRKGLDLKHEVAHLLAESYHSDFVATVRAQDHQHTSGRLTVHLAREFGFCYGVDRAIDYAYQTCRRFPDRRVFLTGEIIHNPHVNRQLRDKGVRFLTDVEEQATEISEQDIVILPAFGVPIDLLTQLESRGCTLVDTTCGSVLNVWKNVRRYARDGFTSIIHGKFWHEETRATASQALHAGDGRYLVVLDREQAGIACDYIRQGGAADAFLQRFNQAASPNFHPDRDLQRVGCANQTTMLSSESLEIGEMFRSAMADRYGAADLSQRFRTFDTICSATQDRQDAMTVLLDEHPLDLVLVLGGYNSSNTKNLARMCVGRLPVFHIASPDCLLSDSEIAHRPPEGDGEVITTGWLPQAGPLAVGLTSGASTPDNLVADVIHRLSALANPI
ncbi:MAG: 4-hydroxy-3-methylbut-2-enyl diphosphate reductase [Vicinamibacterales bacterium]